MGIYRFIAIPIKISTKFFKDMEREILKFILKGKKKQQQQQQKTKTKQQKKKKQKSKIYSFYYYY